MRWGDIETYPGADGHHWSNRVVGSGIAANQRDSKAKAQAKGREMARVRHVSHYTTELGGLPVLSDE